MAASSRRGHAELRSALFYIDNCTADCRDSHNVQWRASLVMSRQWDLPPHVCPWLPCSPVICHCWRLWGHMMPWMGGGNLWKVSLCGQTGYLLCPGHELSVLSRALLAQPCSLGWALVAAAAPCVLHPAAWTAAAWTLGLAMAAYTATTEVHNHTPLCSTNSSSPNLFIQDGTLDAQLPCLPAAGHGQWLPGAGQRQRLRLREYCVCLCRGCQSVDSSLPAWCILGLWDEVHLTPGRLPLALNRCPWLAGCRQWQHRRGHGSGYSHCQLWLSQRNSQ